MLKKAKVYRGIRYQEGDRKGLVESVTVNGQPLHNYDYVKKTSCVFEWGCGGQAPYTLALSIICDYFEVSRRLRIHPIGVRYPTPLHERYLQPFLRDFVKNWPHDGDFTVTSQQIANWIAAEMIPAA